MSALHERTPAGQLANVSAVLIVRTASSATEEVRDTACLLARLFEDVVIIGGDASLREWGRRVVSGEAHEIAAGLDAAREERVLVVMVGEDHGFTSAELLLGLTAWPEHECVAPCEGGRVNPSCALLQRNAALRVVREEALPEVAPLDALMGRLGAGAIEGDDRAALLGANPRLS